MINDTSDALEYHSIMSKLNIDLDYLVDTST